ncbi:hypothetical protein [Candidatus Frankia alpina]|uniref:Uncharacterized protein n=1 Tax=Candidatus Frankia alpina TaxID=2699483 RepID=A0A4V3Z7N3_9ACTN|nr:hypothetical protein [Candidatus Frankia alpina]THJ74729.1 hypothetical protein E7Y31_09740 [Candidatus Frankia alpina]
MRNANSCGHRCDRPGTAAPGLRRISNRGAAVLDAKYKIEIEIEIEIEKDADSPDTIYQLLAYCTALGLPAGHVVYAGTSTEARHTYTLTTGTTITFHPLDLTADLHILRRQINEIASDMANGPSM